MKFTLLFVCLFEFKIFVKVSIFMKLERKIYGIIICITTKRRQNDGKWTCD